MTYTCTDCGETYTETIPALGHDYARTEADGSYVYTCTRCGDSYSEPIVTTSYTSVSSIANGNQYVITVYSNGAYYALIHDGTTLGAAAVTVSGSEITSEVTDDMLWTYSGSKFSFQYDSTIYYLGRYGYSSLAITTYGTTASYRSNRLGLGNYYLRYSNGYFSLSRYNYSTCYMFVENN